MTGGWTGKERTERGWKGIELKRGAAREYFRLARSVVIGGVGLEGGYFSRRLRNW